MRDLHQDWRGRKQAIAEMASEQGERRAVTAAQLVELISVESMDLGVLNGALQTLVALGRAALARLQPLLEHSLSEVRQAAAVVLGQLESPLGAPLLQVLLEDKDVNVRYHAIEALGQQGSLAAVPRLAELAGGDDAFLSFAALEALADIGDCRALPDLCALLGRPDVGASAAEALGRIGHPQALGPLLRVFGQPDEVALAIEALVRANPSLEVSFSPEQRQWLVAQRCFFALERAGGFYPEQDLLEVIRVQARPETLKQALHHESSEVRLAAAQALRDQAVLKELLPEFPEQVAPYLDDAEILAGQLVEAGACARLALVEHGLRGQTPSALLLDLLHHPQVGPRAAAGRWLAAAGQLPEGWLEAEAEERVRCEVLETVCSLGVLQRYLSSVSEGVVALRRLAEWPPEQALPLLEASPRRQDLWWCISLCRTLGRWRRRPDWLEEMLDDLRPPVRAEAVKALAQADSQRAVERLPALLIDVELDVAEAALQALGWLDCWEPVRQALEEKRLRECAQVVLADSPEQADLLDLPLEALLRAENFTAFEVLLGKVELLTREQCERLRQAISENGWRPAVLPETGRRWMALIFQDYPEIMRQLYHDPDPWVRRGALVGLFQELNEAARHDADDKIRHFAAS